MVGKRNICYSINMYLGYLPSFIRSLFAAFSLLDSDLIGVADTGVILSFPMTKGQLNKRLSPKSY